MDILNTRMKLRHEIYFSLTEKQQRKFDKKYSVHFLERVGLSELSKITKSKKINKLYRNLLKTYNLTLFNIYSFNIIH